VRTLTRYLLARFLGFVLAILGVVLMTLLITTLLLDFDDVLDPNRGLLWTLVKLLLQIPAESLRTALPISALAAALACFGISARWLEVTAMKAGGISPIRAALPVLAAAFVLSGLSLLLDQTLSVQAARALDRHLHGSQEEQVTLGRGSFWYHRGNALFNVQESDPDRGVVRGLVIYERSAVLDSLDLAALAPHAVLIDVSTAVAPGTPTIPAQGRRGEVERILSAVHPEATGT